MKRALVLVGLVALGAVAGCSSRQAYDGVQQGAQNECRQLPPAQIDDCLAKNRQSYDDYQRERNY